MRILLHTCCGPCAIVPLEDLSAEGHELACALLNPNIHPYLEFEKRNEAAREVAEHYGVAIVREDPYGLVGFLRAVVGREDERCPICYAMRLGRAAEVARELGFDGFTTTMLVSTHQDHELIRKLGEDAAARHGVEFVYRDFRPRVMDGVRKSKEMGHYRQQYCGCIYSEHERYAGGRSKRRKRSTGGENRDPRDETREQR